MLVNTARDAVEGNGDELALEAIGPLSGDGIGRITQVVQVVPRSELISQMQ